MAVLCSLSLSLSLSLIVRISVLVGKIRGVSVVIFGVESDGFKRIFLDFVQ